MLLKVNGTDITSMVFIEGLKWTESDIHSDDSGRDMDGTMHIIPIGTKVQLDINCVALNQTNAANLLSKIKQAPPLIVTYDDPATGNSRTANFYSSDRSCEFLKECRGVKWWKNISFSLIEC